MRTLRTSVKRVLMALMSYIPQPLSALSILMYHSVSKSGAFFAVDPAHFDTQMKYLKDTVKTVIFASEIESLLRSGSLSGSVCITFDDGYMDVYTEAFPILRKYGLKATVFLITSQIGGSYTNSEGRTFSLLGEREINEMQASGVFEFMPHGHTHAKLTALDTAAQKEEIMRSRDIVRALTNSDARVFSYPRGRFTPLIAALVKDLGFTTAVGVSPGLVERDTDRFAMPRNAVDSTVSFPEFKVKISDHIGRYAAIARSFRQV